MVGCLRRWRFGGRSAPRWRQTRGSARMPQPRSQTRRRIASQEPALTRDAHKPAAGRMSLPAHRTYSQARGFRPQPENTKSGSGPSLHLRKRSVSCMGHSSYNRPFIISTLLHPDRNAGDPPARPCRRLWLPRDARTPSTMRLPSVASSCK